MDDLAAYRKKIVDAGGKTMVDDQEVPGMGRLCLFTDPEGRVLGLWKGNSDSKSRCATTLQKNLKERSP